MSSPIRRFCLTCGERYWVRFDTDRGGHHVELVEPCACERAAKAATTPTDSEEMITMGSQSSAEGAPVHGKLAEQIREALRLILRIQPTLSMGKAHKEVEKHLKREVFSGNVYPQWKRIRAELGITDEPSNGNGRKTRLKVRAAEEREVMETTPVETVGPPFDEVLHEEEPEHLELPAEEREVAEPEAAVIEAPLGGLTGTENELQVDADEPVAQHEELHATEEWEPEGVYVEQTAIGWEVRVALFARSRSEAFRLAAGLMLATEPAYLHPRADS